MSIIPRVLRWTVSMTLVFAGITVQHPARAQSSNVWNGPYVGVLAGAAHDTSCSRWSASVAGVDASASTPSNVACAGSALVGGAQVGDNFQYGSAFWGVSADFDYWASGDHRSTVGYTGATIPSGDYTFSDRLTPRVIAILGPRIGYAGRDWMPYLRGGALLSFGRRDDALFYTAPGASRSTATFGGSKAFSSSGWAAGGGAEWGLNGAWSISAEFLHVSVGKATSEASGCSGGVVNCASLSSLSFSEAHDAARANMFRIAVSYWFDYWNI